jgi:WD40 repeat protein
MTKQTALRLCISFSMVVLGGDAAYAATRYVDNSGSPACSNSTSYGSETQPWCTITYGLARIASSDDLYVKQGTYNEELYISGPAGTASKNTVIRTYPGHTVTVRGGGNTGRARITGTSYLTFDGFIVTNFNQGIFVDNGSHHITIQNCSVHDVGQEGMHVKEGSSFVTIQGCTVYNTMKLGGCCNGEGIYVGSSTNATADQWTHDITIRNNVIHDTTSEGIEIKPGTYNCVVDDNTLYRTNSSDHYAAIEVDERDASPQYWTGNPNHVIRNNVMYDNYNGIRLGTGATAYNNVVWNTASGYRAILIDNLNGDSFTRYVYHNTVVDGGISNSGATADVRNNIGTTGTSNVAFNATFFVNAAARDYHLLVGTAPVNAGANLTSVVAVDKDGKPRSTGTAPDLGAYEYVPPTVPTAPTNLRISGG